MSGLFQTYKYVIDTSALIDLKGNYPPKIFPGVWNNFNKMCNALEIISVREVYNEIKRGTDWLNDWVKEYDKIFLEPTIDEYNIIRSLQTSYPHLVDYTSDRPAADPFVIACAKHHNIKIIQHERLQTNKQKIPYVANKEGLMCIKLTDLFELEHWEFK